MSNVKLGRNVRLQKGGTDIGKVTSPNLSASGQTISLTGLGDNWDTFELGMRSYTLSFNLLMIADDAGQNAIWTAFEDGDSINDLKLVVLEDGTASITFECDTATDSEACMLVTGYNITADNGSAVQVSVTLQGSGPLKKTG